MLFTMFKMQVSHFLCPRRLISISVLVLVVTVFVFVNEFARGYDCGASEER